MHLQLSEANNFVQQYQIILGEVQCRFDGCKGVLKRHVGRDKHVTMIAII